ncbi:hypothetical protein [Candidatus Avelusimicrobium fimicolum]|uniref:hypothetical protein n=1 Tax=Candidatus Avelusimicrobium fimicolum TaxID=3416216 RepID=UPI003D11E339
MKKEYTFGNQTVEMDPKDPVFVLGVLYGLRHAREMLEIHKVEQGEKPNPLAVLVNDFLDDLNNKLETGEQVIAKHQMVPDLSASIEVFKKILKISRKDLPAIFDKMLVSLFNGGKSQDADKNENK